jgi:ferredoxin--NADP+ reductase
MCGACRVTVGGETRFACVDGPEFDGHAVDFGELSDRLSTYRPFESAALERREACKIPAMAVAADKEAEAAEATQGASR